MITTTLTRIRAHLPCEEGWVKLLAHLDKIRADDDPLTFATILKSNGLGAALWCCRVEPQYSCEWRLFAVWCGRRVQHLMTDPRSLTALNVAERHAMGKATDAERARAWVEAREAALHAVDYGARNVAREAAKEEAWDAAWAASGIVPYASARAAAAAREEVKGGYYSMDEDAAWKKDWEKAWKAAWQEMRKEFLRIVTETEAR